MFLSYIFGNVALLVVLPVISVLKTIDSTTTTTKPFVKKYPMPENFRTTMTAYGFEDVDWQVHSAPAKERDDCVGQFIACIRRTTPIVPVCGFNVKTSHFEDYYSLCEIEVENCLWRITDKKPMYEATWWVNKIYHSGEDYDCNEVARRANSLEEIEQVFFGGDKNTVLMEWNRRNYEFYYLNNQIANDEERGEEGIIDQYNDF